MKTLIWWTLNQRRGMPREKAMSPLPKSRYKDWCSTHRGTSLIHLFTRFPQETWSPSSPNTSVLLLARLEKSTRKTGEVGVGGETALAFLCNTIYSGWASLPLTQSQSIHRNPWLLNQVATWRGWRGPPPTLHCGLGTWGHAAGGPASQ